jgi:hypothetical protein
MQDMLRQRELEVEQARARFADDLAVLRSPKTFAAFTDDLKQDAMETKDELVEQARHAVESKVTGVVEDLKAKAAANPAAALMIGAGIGWYLLRRPPITTALIGCGLFSLLRTQASAQPNAQTSDYVRQGQERLKQQASGLASQAAEAATDMARSASAAVAEKSGELYDAAKEQVTRLAQNSGDAVSANTAAVQEQVGTLMAKAGGVAADLSDRAQDATQRASSQVSDQISRSFDAIEAAKNALPDGDTRDQVLLGVAGLAVAAALGIAWQRRVTENV